MDTLFYLCNRKLTAEALANIPHDKQPTYEELDQYQQRHPSPPNLPYTDRFPELCAWLSDYEEKRKMEADNPPQQGGGAFDYHS